MSWKKDYLDAALVPSGLLIMFGYHLFLLYRCMKHPHDTIICLEDHCRRTWVSKMMQVDVDNRGTAFTVISNNLSAATFMASTSLGLTSLIGTWVGSSTSQLPATFIYGSTSQLVNSIKFISIQIAFWLAFGAFIQCTRSYVHAIFLMSMPQAHVSEEYVTRAVIEGTHFWEIGLRAIYFASTLLMWVFGPIPMFVCSVAVVIMLYILDNNKAPFLDFRKKIHHELDPTLTAIEDQDRLQENKSSTSAAYMENGTGFLAAG
ncbi:hypothetical protein Dimus_018911 [Dionaea muscipula]